MNNYPTQLDEIDQWLVDNLGIMPGACLSIEDLRHKIAEALWPKDKTIQQDTNYIDLGLPSGTKWASCNVGADKPEEYGKYYTFDEVQELNVKVPTIEQWDELIKECTWFWAMQNRVKGYLVTGHNGNRIFLPAVGYRGGTYLNDAGSYSLYWSSSLNTDYPHCAWYVYFDSDNVYRGYINRFNGQSVRAVLK